MVLERWRPPALRPWRAPRFMEDVEHMMDEAFAGLPFRATWRRFPQEEMSWAPSMEIYEKDDGVVVRAELPGVKEDDIDISVTGDTLTIKGERKSSEEVKDEQYHRCEVCYGSFVRSVVLPQPVDAEKIEATYENGMLEIRVPKAEEAKATKVKVKAK